MTAGNIFILALIVASLAFFLYRLSFLLRLTNLGQGSFNLDGKADRLKSLLIKGFGQHLVLRKISGIGHFFIFWGFFFLSFGAVEGLLSGVIPGFSFATLGSLYSFINSGQDIFGLLVIGALLISLFRRLILRPIRLEGSSRHSVDALVVVGFILALIATSYGLNVMAPKPGWTPVTDLLRSLITEKAGETVKAGTALSAFAWGHNSVFLVFLVYILYSKHSHILFALPNIYLKEDRHPGLIEKLDLEGNDVQRFGAQFITDFKKKDLLDLFACSECGRCQESCPAYNTGKPLSPKSVIQDLKDHLLLVGPALLKNPAPPASPPLYSGTINSDTIWACTTCGACNEACPVENTPMHKILEIRQASVLMAGDLPQEAQLALQNIETQSNPWGFPQENRAQWAEGLGVKTLAEDPSVEYLLYVGCAGSYDQRYISVSKALVKILQQAGISFGILGNEELCTGDSARRIGNDYLAQELANANVATMDRYGVKKIIASCPHCFNTLKNEYPQHGGHYEVFHHSEFISALIGSGRLKPAKQEGLETRKVTYHDSCYLGRYNRLLDKPRELIAYSGGAELIELKRNRKDSFCCGAGGGRMWMEERNGVGINVARATEIIESGADTVATACPFCMSMLADGIKHQNKGGEIQVIDIAEFFIQHRDSQQEMAIRSGTRPFDYHSDT
jgi:Fe-S oxidoreductase